MTGCWWMGWALNSNSLKGLGEEKVLAVARAEEALPAEEGEAMHERGSGTALTEEGPRRRSQLATAGCSLDRRAVAELEGVSHPTHPPPLHSAALTPHCRRRSSLCRLTWGPSALS